MDNVQMFNDRLKEHMLSLRNPEAWQHSLSLTRESLDRYPSDDPRLAAIRHVVLVGHGTSYATSLNAEYFFTRFAKVYARAIPAYQFRQYPEEFLLEPEQTLVIGISCGGNTVSVVESLRMAQEKGAVTMCFSHEQEHGMAAFADYRINADTKVEVRAEVMAYSVSHEFLLAATYFTALDLGKRLGTLSNAELADWQEKFDDMLGKLSCLPALWDQMEAVAAAFREKQYRNLVVLGSGPNFGTMTESALKICEFAWLFGAGEELEDFAHGRFREIDGNIPLFIISPTKRTYAKTMDILTGCAISKSPSVVFTSETTPALEKLATRIILMPRLDEWLTPFLYIFAPWFFGFHIRNMDHEMVGEKRFNLYAADINFPVHFDELGNPKD